MMTKFHTTRYILHATKTPRLILGLAFALIFSSMILTAVPAAAMTLRTPGTSSYSQNIGLNRGLVGWWTMDGKDLSGTQVYDKSGQNNTGTRNGGTSAVIGKLGQAMKFDGSTGYITATNSGSLQINTGTMSVWIKTSNAGVNYRFIVNKQSAYSINTVNNSIGFYDWSTGIFRTTGVDISDNKWHLISATFQSGVTNGTLIYVDGVLKITTTITVLAQTGGFYIGENSSQKFTGLIDDVRIYNRALSASEVMQLYKMGGGKINASVVNKGGTLTSGLVGHWTFDGADMTATTVLDKSGLNNTGTRNSVIPTIGKIGQALSFNGSSSYVAITTSTNAIDNLTQFTVSSWIYPTKDVIGPYRIYNQGNTNDILFYIPGGPGSLQLFINNQTNATVSSPANSVVINKWQLATVTWTSSTGAVNIYVNGVNVKSGTLSASSVNGTGKIYIGSYPTGALQNWLGKLDDVRVYNRALSATEVKQLYAQGLGNKVSTTPGTQSYRQSIGINSGLAGWWTMDGKDFSDATHITDRSGAGNTGTLTGGVVKATGKIGQALKFDGTGNIRFTRTNYGTVHTISIWAKLNATDKLQPLVCYFDGQGNGLYLTTNQVRYTANDTLSWNYTYDLKWHYYTIVRNGATAELFIDGISYGQKAINSSDQFQYIDGFGSRYFDYFNGSIDDVRIWNRALSATEVKQLYAMGK